MRPIATDSGLDEVRLGAASYVSGEINTSFTVPMFYIDAVRDHDGQAAWISGAGRGRHWPRPQRALDMLTEPGHRETRNLEPAPARYRQAWQDFRAYCAACDQDSNLVSHRTADGDNAIGLSSGSNAAVLIDTGTILISTARRAADRTGASASVSSRAGRSTMKWLAG